MGVEIIVIRAAIDEPPITIRVFVMNELITDIFFSGISDSDCELIKRPCYS
jgi:hypothetical protein